jgi:hypothetical protein
MMIHRIIKVILKALVSYAHSSGDGELENYDVDADAGYFQDYFGVSPYTVVDAWLTRSSDFEFMESTAAPQESKLAISLLGLLRRVGVLYEHIEDRRSHRLEEGKRELPHDITSLVVHVHELSLVEILCDHPEITSAVTDQSHLLERQIRRILSKVRQNVSTFIQSLVDHRLDDMAGSSRLSMSSQTHQAHHKPQEVCLLKAPFKSSQMNKWDQLFSNDWIEDLLNDNSELLIYLSELRDDVYHIFESSEPGSIFKINEMSLDDLWEEVIKPYYVNEVRREIHQARAVDIMTDVTRCFE